ncbi:ribonuclease D [Anaplasma bovis]|uniref:ribonuclease D n=1 Tax=Anaplasma bovis TaxID=186733 RepID=UPI002FEED0CA
MLICTTRELSEFCDLVLQDNPESVAVDTEFARSFNDYYPELCLLQIACGKHSCVIDVLRKDLDLSPVLRIFDNTKIFKVFHDCRQDLEALSLVLASTPKPVFDTQIAAMLCAYYENFVGYSKLVEEFLDIKLNKLLFKRVDWTHRPLSEGKLRYALDDVIYLDKLYWIFKDMLHDQGKTSWFAQEMENVEDISNCNYGSILEGMNFFSDLTDSQMIIAISVIEWREKVARLLNINRNIVMCPKSALCVIKELGTGGGEEKLRAYVNDAYLRNLPFDLDDIIRRNNEKRPELQIGVDCDRSTLNVLGILLQSVCKEREVSQKLVASKSDLVRSICGVDNNLMRGWRYELFGHRIENFVKGRTRLSFSMDGTKLLAEEEEIANLKQPHSSEK